MTETTLITPWEYSVLSHTSVNGRYVTDEQRVLDLATAGYLNDYGPQRLADGMHYLTLTGRGRTALNDYKASLPPPPKPTRRPRKPEFDSWRSYCEACDSIPFSEFLKQIWHTRRYL